jgi:uncharacterized protein (TIGR03435 family)
MRSLSALSVGLLLAVTAAAQQTAAPVEGPVLTPTKRFDAASVKASKAAARAPMLWQPGGRFTMSLPILSLLSIGYQVPAFRIEGIPEWARGTFFDINARADGEVRVDERAAYYRGLLEERFTLVVHVEQRELPAYALALARSDGRLGPGLRRSSVDCAPVAAERRARAEAGERAPGLPSPGERPVCALVGAPAGFSGGAVTVPAIAGWLGGGFDRPVIDRTGLTGVFDVDFRSAPIRVPDAGRAQTDLPSVFAAVQEQLGLKLEAIRAPITVLVIDRIQMPEEN